MESRAKTRSVTSMARMTKSREDAASGIAGFRDKLKLASLTTPLRRNVTQDEVGNAALYLASQLSSGVTGEIHFVDAGANILGETVVMQKAGAEGQ